MSRLSLIIATLALAVGTGELLRTVFLGDDDTTHRCGPIVEVPSD